MEAVSPGILGRFVALENIPGGKVGISEEYFLPVKGESI
jgi:hypothetical protein